jgi:hypothetical protein
MGSVDLKLLTGVFEELGVRATFDANTLGLAGRREQRDVVHAACEGYSARRLRALSWDPRLEVEVGTGRWRGWIDLLAYRPTDRALILGEIKSDVDDVGRMERTVGWYEREAFGAATRLGWRPRIQRTVLLVLASDRNDERLMRNAGALAETFHGSASHLAPWLAEVGPDPPERSIALIDPRSRRHVWVRPTRSQGRRTPAPYRDYADAARVLTTPRARPR